MNEIFFHIKSFYNICDFANTLMGYLQPYCDYIVPLIRTSG